MSGRAICIIPARGGSKRVPGKNIRPFAGKPLIAHSVAAALESGLFADVVVSTDDEAIAGIAREHGASVPFMRDPALADDHAGTAEVVLDAIGRIGAAEFDHVCCLYPTAPLVTADDLRAAQARLVETGAEGLVAVTDYDFPPLRAFHEGNDGRLAFNWPEHALTRSQDLPELLHDAGAFYWLRIPEFLDHKRLIPDNTTGYRLPRWRAVDIDTEDDFRFAQFLFERLATEGGHGDA